MATLNSEFRKLLEKAIIKARDLAEVALRSALENLGVGAAKAPGHLDEAGRTLRTRLRAHGRQLGDARRPEGNQALDHLIQEGAYEHWHRMLFARFLAENDLLIHPEHGVGVTLNECEELAKDEGCGAWDLAGRYASRMLPQIFRPQDPVLGIELAPEHQQALEKLLGDLPTEVFMADDSLGWVYQFWQSKRKDEVNASEVKIGAEELPAVTQLFTEDYMVDFLLHNSLGAWWTTRHPGEPCPVPLTYLRTLEDGTPAAGKFEGWPDCLKDFTLLDPCCGSGHFLVAAFRLMVALRMADEGLGAADAVDAVLSQNIHGLELDARCVEIAVFALALAAWTTRGNDGRPLGVRTEMPSPAVACCGLKPASRVEDWLALVPERGRDADRLKAGLERLHRTFQQAPLLGSLLDPGREVGGLYEANFEELGELLAQALATEDNEIAEQALSAKGLMEAAQLLGAQYNLVITNVPYRKRGDHCEELKDFCASFYPDAKADLANVFLERCLELSRNKGEGVIQIVMPQNWLFQEGYKEQREKLLKRVSWNLVIRLGAGAFETISGEVVKAILLTQTQVTPKRDSFLRGLDASDLRTAKDKANLLMKGEVLAVIQYELLNYPDARVILQSMSLISLLGSIAKSVQGIKTGDDSKTCRCFWEVVMIKPDWTYYQSTVSNSQLFGGLEGIISWIDDGKSLARRQGAGAWGKWGVAISQMSSMPCAVYMSEKFDSNMTAIVPHDGNDLLPLFSYALSGELQAEVRKIDSSIKPTNGAFEKIPFDKARWRLLASEMFADGLPKPYSCEPSQWLFHGHPKPSTEPLMVSMGRLLGYRWPAETDKSMELSDEAKAWIARCVDLESLVDEDGILPIPAIRGEQPGEGRLRQMLAKAFGVEWSTSKEQDLLKAVGYGGKSLEVWLRDGYFEQHCKLFQQRPFIWQVWDGLRDGFSVLVNYHKLDRKGLESLTYSYLGDWITRQKDGVARNESGAQVKLEKALELQTKLVAILEGEQPYDIFVRWKPLAQQPIGWEPDLNDGVRLNIRPFMTAGVLRKDPKINWNKDRGTDVESAPWFNLGPQYGGKKGDRINDHHLGLEEKRKAREKAKK